MARIVLQIDDPTTKLTLRTMLAAVGHEVGGGVPEVLITDKPREALGSVSSCPTLLVATMAQVADAVAVMREGVFGYILLPFQPGEAALMVERALASRNGVGQGQAEDNFGLSLEAIEARHILHTLRRCKNNQSKAAVILEIGRNTLWRKLKRIREHEDDDLGETGLA